MGIARVSEECLRKLHDLRLRTGKSIQEMLDEAVEIYRRAKFVEHANAAFAHLREDSAQWKQEQGDRADWDATLGDGQEGAAGVPRFFVANCMPENWDGCRRGTIFGVKKPAAKPEARAGDILILRINDPRYRRDYGVRAVWRILEVEQARQVPWSDGPYGWVIRCADVATLPRLVSEDFVGKSKLSSKMAAAGVHLTAGRYKRSLVEVPAKTGEAYIDIIERELGTELEAQTRRRLAQMKRGA